AGTNHHASRLELEAGSKRLLHPPTTSEVADAAGDSREALLELISADFRSLGIEIIDHQRDVLGETGGLFESVIREFPTRRQILRGGKLAMVTKQCRDNRAFEKTCW